MRKLDYKPNYRPSWGHTPAKRHFDEGKCMELVHDQSRSVGFHWCHNRAKPDDNYCGVHNAEAVARRRAKRNQREAAVREQYRQADERRRRRLLQLDAYRAALQDIANGCNDARARARDVLDFNEEDR